MIEFAIPGAIALIALLTIIVVVGRHVRQVAALDLESLPAEQEAAMKAALLERRLKRKMLSAKNRVLPLFRRFGGGVGNVFRSMQQRVAQMEQRYRRKPQLMSASEQQDMKQKIQSLLNVAQEYTDKEAFADAEKAYIEALSWDPKNPNAYLSLAEMYVAKKEFAQAKETFQFFFKLVRAQKAGEEQISLVGGPVDDASLQRAHFDYGLSFQVTGDLVAAKKEIEEALKMDEKNPKYLDKLLELSILLKDRDAAKKAFQTLKSANPENQKLSDFEEQIRAL